MFPSRLFLLWLLLGFLWRFPHVFTSLIAGAFLLNSSSLGGSDCVSISVLSLVASSSTFRKVRSHFPRFPIEVPFFRSKLSAWTELSLTYSLHLVHRIMSFPKNLFNLPCPDGMELSLSVLTKVELGASGGPVTYQGSHS